jgi:iron complex transport system ATP-binding protein
LLSLRDIRFGFARRPEFLGPVSLELRAGECWAIVGPNGAGKSTLLRVMAGRVRPTSGDVGLRKSAFFQSPLRDQVVVQHDGIRESSRDVATPLYSPLVRGEEVAPLSARERARVIAYVPQLVRLDGELTARELVLLGRYPHQSVGFFESPEDERVAERAMGMTETRAFRERLIGTLSGGEAQRVHIAAALAQEPRLLLLDEPTASLDLKHQLQIFQLLHELSRRDGLCVVIATHDLNLAARFCSHVLLLNDGQVVAQGDPNKVLSPEILEPVYDVNLASFSVGGASPSIGGGAAGRWIVPIERVDESEA